MDKPSQALIAESICRLRKVRGLSQQQLAFEMGTNNGSYIAGVETGKKAISLCKLDAFMRVFRISASAFFYYAATLAKRHSRLPDNSPGTAAPLSKGPARKKKAAAPATQPPTRQRKRARHKQLRKRKD